jgi:hypothetical protein
MKSSGGICCKLEKPYSDGSANVIFEPLGFIGKLAALISRPRINLTRFHRGRTQQLDGLVWLLISTIDNLS